MPEQDDADFRPERGPWAPPDPSPVPSPHVPPAAPSGWGQPPATPGWGPPPPGQQPGGGQQPATPGWGQTQGRGQTHWGAQPPPGQPPGWGQPAWGAQPPWQQHPWGWAPPPPDPRARRRKRLVAFGALGGVVLLLVGTIVGAGVYEDRRQERVAREVAALVPVLQEFVAQTRGLPFLEPVEVEVLDDDEFLDALYEEPADAPEEREDRDPEPTLKALGLLEDDADLEEQVTDSLDAGVVGFYDPTTDRLVVRGRDVDAIVELVMVHELTHALQDQHFDIHRPELDEGDDERGLAFSALVEGDASLVEQAWYDQLPPSKQGEIDAGFGSPASGDPDVVEALLGFPYYAGPTYVAGLLESGGQEALDAAYAEPPTTTEQVLAPAQAAPPREVPLPEQDGELVDAGVLGLLGLALLLEVDPTDLGDTRLVEWAGDGYVTVEDGDRTCTVAHVASDSPVGRIGLRADLDRWARTQPDARITDGPDGLLALTACD